MSADHSPMDTDASGWLHFAHILVFRMSSARMLLHKGNREGDTQLARSIGTRDSLVYLASCSRDTGRAFARKCGIAVRRTSRYS